MTDTHTHLYFLGLEEDERDCNVVPESLGLSAPEGVESVQRAIDAGVYRMIFPAVDTQSIAALIDLHGHYPKHTYMAFGLHPSSVGEMWREELQLMEEYTRGVRPVAVGEIGMDLYWDASHRREQIEAFGHQVEKAMEHDMPLIIHCRNALDDTLGVLREFGGRAKGVFHSFTGSSADVEAVRSAGDFFFGINGVVTYKNAPLLREALSTIGLERIVLETDSPYLSPVPLRGRRNESCNLVYIRDAVGKVLGMDPAAVAQATDVNADSLFGLS